MERTPKLDMTKTFIFINRAIRKVVLGPREALLLIRMAGWVGLFSVAVRVFSLPRALRLVSTTTRQPSKTPEAETQQRLADAIDLLLKADLFIFKPICWKRAALLHRYLALNGITTRILFGIRPDGDSVSGHAWLESSGKTILETTAPNYAVTYAFPSHETVKVDLDLLTETESR